MTQEGKADAAAHQPSKTELEEDVSVDATPEALARAITRGGAEKRAHKGSTSNRQKNSHSIALQSGNVVGRTGGVNERLS